MLCRKSQQLAVSGRVCLMHTGHYSMSTPLLQNIANDWGISPIKSPRSGAPNKMIPEIFSVEKAGVFKPDPRVYQLAVDELNVKPEEIAFQSSNAWDASGAAAFGFKVAWINRFGQSPERLPGKPDVEIQSLSELPELPV